MKEAFWAVYYFQARGLIFFVSFTAFCLTKTSHIVCHATPKSGG